MKKCFFEVENRCPVVLDCWADFTTSAVNAVAISIGCKWEDVVRSLMDQAHIRAYMPSYITCVTDMLRANGFVPEPDIWSMRGLKEKRTEKSNSLDSYIVRVQSYGYCAIVPLVDGSGYCMKGIRETKRDLTDSYFEACWKFVPGTDNRTGIRRRGFAITNVTDSHNRLEVVNMNPQDHYVGDCSVRALCAALECSWDEAIDLLAKASRYTNPIINSLSNINSALIQLEFERHRAIRRNGRRLTGKQFCNEMNHTFHSGERIFAYVGRSHCAAILPFREPDGSLRYKTQDTWDSTDQTIGDFWVIPPKAKREKAIMQEKKLEVDKEANLTTGSNIVHPSFGKGIIVSDEGGFFTVDFEEAGTKKISKEWLLRSIRNNGY